MIKINLTAEKKQAKGKAATAVKAESGGGGQNVLLGGIVLVGLVVAAGWWWMLNSEIDSWQQKHAEADTELERLEEIRAKGEEYKRRKELLARKIDLITELKKKQAVPVHILDQVSKNLPDFVWLDQMSASNNLITIAGKATTYNAVSSFYGNLTGSGVFGSVTLGRTFEIAEGVSFSLTCAFAATPASDAEADAGAEESQG